MIFFAADAALTCAEIGDGNLNYVFRVKDNASGRSLIVKQAGTHLRISDAITLTTDRGRIEANILKLQGALSPGQTLKIYLYDNVMCAMIMEDMIGHVMVRTGFIRHGIYPHFADQITTFLVNSLLMTTDIVMDHQERKALVKEFSNPELCDITENLVFDEPVLNYNGRNDVFAPIEDFVKKEIYRDEELKAAVARLKFRFMNHAQALLHGDLHIGSIFINQKHIFVFDPEFAFFGPMGYDIGNVIANIFFAWANGNAVIQDFSERKKFCQWCVDTIMEIVDTFNEKFLRLYDDKATDPLAMSEDFKTNYLREILSYTAGYAGTECIRRIVGIAHNPLLPPEKTILDYNTVDLDDDKHALVIIDQINLPSKIEILSLTKQKDIWDAIYLLKVRGAPAIGVAAAIGIYLAAQDISAHGFDLTDHDLIAGIVTEYGVAYSPYEQSLKEIFLKKQIRNTVQQMMKEMDAK